MERSMNQEQLRDFLLEAFSKLVKIKPAEIDTKIAFDRFGLDSAAAVEFTSIISKKLGRELEPTLLYDYSTIDQLTKFLLDARHDEAVAP